ncbi:hypothetical protein [Streptomyces sp. NPDC056632]|uniref:hypothetical protein n=1 Tax=Streptomyces sp. NPDC056632 TaxID=3345884 RepID=UPI00368BE1B4
MSAPEERAALAPRPSLYAYASSRLDAEPDGRRPRDGCPAHAADAPPGGPRLRGRKATSAVHTALGPLLREPDTPVATEALTLRLAELPVGTGAMVGALLSLPLDHHATARAIGRRRRPGVARAGGPEGGRGLPRGTTLTRSKTL